MDYEIREQPEFSKTMEKLEPTNKAHADIFNAMFQVLLDNDNFTKEEVEALKKSVVDGKQLVAAALNAKGQATEPDAAFGQIADNINGIYRKIYKTFNEISLDSTCICCYVQDGIISLGTLLAFDIKEAVSNILEKQENYKADTIYLKIVENNTNKYIFQGLLFVNTCYEIAVNEAILGLSILEIDNQYKVNVDISTISPVQVEINVCIHLSVDTAYYII